MKAHMYGNLEQAWRATVAHLLDHGDETSPRGMKTREVVGASFTLADASRNIVWNRTRKINHVFSVAEWLWMLLGRRDVRSIAFFNKNIAKYSDDGETFFGAYGPWLVAQMPHVVSAIKRDPDTRQAVVTLWQQSPPATKDVPCTVALQFLLRCGRLHAVGYMRSNDAWLGLPYDVFNFTRVQAYVAALVGADVGSYTHNVGSLHLYEEHWAAAENALYEPPAALPEPVSPPLTPVSMAALDAAFVSATDPLSPTAWSREATASRLDEPWRTYIDLLFYKTLKNRALLRAPYDTLIKEPGL